MPTFPTVRHIPVILLLCLLAAGARAQSAVERLDRWARGQEAALTGVRSITMVERGHHMYEGASGPRRMGMDTRYTLGTGTTPPVREVLELTVDGEPHERKPPDRRRHDGNPMQESMQRAVDLLLQPTRLLAEMNPPEEVETIEFNGQQVVSIRTRARDPEAGVARAVWWLDPADGRLVQARVFVESPEGGAFDASVRYDRIEGIDLPVRRRVEGSFPLRRRMRTFTILVDVRADIEGHEIARN
jgi:hypothetical protein